MDAMATLSRSLWDVTGLAHEGCARLADNACGRLVRVPVADSIQGRVWVGSHLSPREFWPIDGFTTYATGWEQRYSVLTPTRSHLKFVPVVSDKSRLSYSLLARWGAASSAFPVIAHYGTARVSEIIVPRKYATTAFRDDRRKALERLLDDGVEAFVEEGYPGGSFGPFAEANNLGPNYFTVLTDPDGRILACLDAFGSEAGLESEDPLSYLMVGAALLKLATAGGRVVFRLASQRAARKAAQRAAARAAINEGTISAEELTTIRGGAATGRRPLLSAEELHKPVPQIKTDMGPRRLLTAEEKSGVRHIINALERIRVDPKNESAWRDLLNRRARPMRYGRYAAEGWKEIDVLPGNPGYANTMRVIFRPVPGDLEVRLLQMH